jgi:hypothetical protein
VYRRALALDCAFCRFELRHRAEFADAVGQIAPSPFHNLSLCELVPMRDGRKSTRWALFEAREMRSVVFDERLPDASATTQRDRARKCERRQRRSCGVACDLSGVGPANRRGRKRVKDMARLKTRQRSTITSAAPHDCHGARVSSGGIILTPPRTDQRRISAW